VCGCATWLMAGVRVCGLHMCGLQVWLCFWYPGSSQFKGQFGVLDQNYKVAFVIEYIFMKCLKKTS